MLLSICIHVWLLPSRFLFYGITSINKGSKVEWVKIYAKIHNILWIIAGTLITIVIQYYTVQYTVHPVLVICCTVWRLGGGLIWTLGSGGSHKGCYIFHLQMIDKTERENLWFITSDLCSLFSCLLLSSTYPHLHSPQGTSDEVREKTRRGKWAEQFSLSSSSSFAPLAFHSSWVA